MELEFLGITLLLAMAGAVAGITAGLFGNGGGFVVVPALVFVFTCFPKFSSGATREQSKIV